MLFVWIFFLHFVTFFYMFSQSWQYCSIIIDSPSERIRFFTPSKESFPEYMLYSTDREKGVSLIFVIHHFFGNLLKIWIDKIRMYNKDDTRLQNKGVNLMVYLIFWTLKWFMYDTITSPFTVSQISSIR